MGLVITGRYSNKRYARSYGALHDIRILSLLSLNLHKDITKEVINDCILKHSYIDKGYDEGKIIRYIMRERLYGDIMHRMYDKKKGIPQIYLTSSEEVQPFHQLLQINDNEGILIKDNFLRDVDYSHSYLIGCLDTLAEELENLKDWISRTDFEITTYEKEIFFELYDLVKEENELGGCLIFL